MAVERARTVPLRTAVWMALGSAAFVGAFFAGVLVARARPEPGGGTAEPLSFAGTLKRGGQAMSGRQSLTFTLRKGEVTCSAGPVEVEVDGEGHFTAPIPLGAPGGCPAGFFDGSDVVLEVGVAGETFTGPVNPVPYAKYAEQVGTPDCPAGYERAPEPPNPANPESILCRKGNDEVVRVGVGASAFWIDRYEASVWSEREGTGVQFGLAGDNDYELYGFNQNGQWTKPIYALSMRDVMPSSWITWYQASEACALSGKALPSNAQWQRAAKGTIDPGLSDGVGPNEGKCVTSGPRRRTGEGTKCTSHWGAEDMVGNHEEIVEEWLAGLGDAVSLAGVAWNGSSYGSDNVYNVASGARPLEISEPERQGIPASVSRGGNFQNGIGAGLFTFDAAYAPSRKMTGFRCYIAR